MIHARRESARYPKDNPLIVVFDIGNARASEEAGMAAIHYRSGADLESELR